MKVYFYNGTPWIHYNYIGTWYVYHNFLPFTKPRDKAFITRSSTWDRKKESYNIKSWLKEAKQTYTKLYKQ